MSILRSVITISVVLAATWGQAADFSEEVAAAAQVLDPAKELAEKLIVEGRLDEANQKLLDVFPDETCTPMQALILGNVLFRQSPKESYRLHKKAVDGLSGEPNAHLEWAMEQHRAGEYAGATKSYSKFLESNQTYAPVLGLIAECLIRTGKIQEASNFWKRCEASKNGRLETFESLVCDVSTKESSDRARADVFQKAMSGDIAAAERLIWIDCGFEFDWWNKRAHPRHLPADLAKLRQVAFENKTRAREVLVAAEARAASLESPEDGAAVLRNGGFLLDDAHTLPESAAMLSIMLAIVESSNSMTEEQMRDTWAEKVFQQATETDDAEAFNIAAHLVLSDKEKLRDIQKTAWDRTGDERFAAGLIASLMTEKKLTLEHEDFVKARAMFPENGIIARAAVSLTSQAGLPMKDVLIEAIKAEYHRFSPRAGFGGGRPSAGLLRAYFRGLADELEKK